MTPFKPEPHRFDNSFARTVSAGQGSLASKRPEFFKTLEFKESRKRSLGMSVVVHGVLLSVLLAIPLIFTDTIKVKFNTVLIAPFIPKEPLLETTRYTRSTDPKPVVVAKPLVTPQPKLVLIEPPELKQPEPAKTAELKLPEVMEPEKPGPTSIEPAIAAPKKSEVRTGIFSTITSATQTTNPAAQRVQTGGFGDPVSIKAEGKTVKIADVASLVSFDLHAGAGVGTASGGAHAGKGTPVNAGFGDGVASTGNGNYGGGSRRDIRQGGFGDVDSAAKPDAPRKPVEAGPSQVPVEILFKPRPDYTDEARKAKIEGEVLVRVLFSANGEVHVVDVVRGLGHGLDENAVRAVQQIKFKPALRNRQPVDSTATVHIVFQLAY